MMTTQKIIKIALLLLIIIGGLSSLIVFLIVPKNETKKEPSTQPSVLEYDENPNAMIARLILNSEKKWVQSNSSGMTFEIKNLNGEIITPDENNLTEGRRIIINGLTHEIKEFQDFVMTIVKIQPVVN